MTLAMCIYRNHLNRHDRSVVVVLAPAVMVLTAAISKCLIRKRFEFQTYFMMAPVAKHIFSLVLELNRHRKGRKFPMNWDSEYIFNFKLKDIFTE